MTAMASVKLNLKPLLVPNYVIIDLPRDGTGRDLPAIPIAELDGDTLEALAYGFLVDFYKKAGKRNPFDRPIAEGPIP